MKQEKYGKQYAQKLKHKFGKKRENNGEHGKNRGKR